MIVFDVLLGFAGAVVFLTLSAALTVSLVYGPSVMTSGLRARSSAKPEALGDILRADRRRYGLTLLFLIVWTNVGITSMFMVKPLATSGAFNLTAAVAMLMFLRDAVKSHFRDVVISDSDQVSRPD